MDPLENLCVVKDSFSSDKNTTYKIEKYSEEFVGSPRARRNRIISGKNNKEENILKIPEVSKSIEISGIFKNMSSYVLANIDTIYNFSKQKMGYLIPQVMNENYKYAILDSDIEHLEYLQYRLPESVGFTNCLKTKSKFPKLKINTNCDNGLSKYVNDIAPEGVDLVVSNTIDVVDNSKQALQMLKKGGIFIQKISEIDLQLLYILTLCFQQFSLFRPFLENENVVYVICEGYLGNSLDIIPLFLEKQNVSYPQTFSDYVSTSLDNFSTEDQTYNFYRCKALMNVE
jgi:hypothetical protein